MKSIIAKMTIVILIITIFSIFFNDSSKKERKREIEKIETKTELKEKLLISKTKVNVPIVLVRTNDEEKKISKLIKNIEEVQDDVFEYNGDNGNYTYDWNIWRYITDYYDNYDDNYDDEIEEKLWRI